MTNVGTGERSGVAAVRELIQVSRRLPLEAGAVRIALLFLALDALSDTRRWTLGPLGALELDTEFTDTALDAASGSTQSVTRGRLCAPDGFTVEVEVALTLRDAGDTRLTLRAEFGSPAHRDELALAARAALDELAEELLFFGSRQQAAN